MRREVVYLPEVSRDFADAFGYYETIAALLGDKFEAAFFAAEREIEEGMITHHLDFTHYHRVNLRRFPYAIYYRIAGQRIVVVALLFFRQDPVAMQQLLKSR